MMRALLHTQSRISSRHLSRCNIAANRSLSSSSDSILWDVETLDNNRRIGIMTLNHPESLNALTVSLARDVFAMVHQIKHDIVTDQQDVDCIILTGSGQAFSAGGNLEWLHSLSNNSVHENASCMLEFYQNILSIRSLPVPTIACLNGPAMGAGAGLALACDLRVGNAKSHKLLGLHFTRLGIHTGLGASHLLKQQNLPATLMNELLLCGKILSGPECLQYGLLNRLSENDTLQVARELAIQVVQDTHPVALRTLVQTLRAQQDVGLQQALQREAMAQAVCYARNDWGQGISAIAEKRPPTFDSYHSK